MRKLPEIKKNDSTMREWREQLIMQSVIKATNIKARNMKELRVRISPKYYSTDEFNKHSKIAIAYSNQSSDVYTGWKRLIHVDPYTI